MHKSYGAEVLGDDIETMEAEAIRRAAKVYGPGHKFEVFSVNVSERFRGHQPFRHPAPAPSGFKAVVRRMFGGEPPAAPPEPDLGPAYRAHIHVSVTAVTASETPDWVRGLSATGEQVGVPASREDADGGRS